MKYKLLILIAIVTCISVATYLALDGCSSRKPVSVQAAVRATLQLSKRGWLMLKVENTGKKPLAFIDVWEGSGACGEVWRVEITLKSGKTLRPFCTYAPAGRPRPVTVNPGSVYTRELQPHAYVYADYKPLLMRPLPCAFITRFLILGVNFIPNTKESHSAANR